MRGAYTVIGLGATGLSCLRFLHQKGVPLVAMDTREEPPQFSSIRAAFPEIPFYLGPSWPQPLLDQAEAIVLSPGVSPHIEPIQKARKKGVPVLGDIALFARENTTPIIAITGTNGKTTVTTLVGDILRKQGHRVIVGGNIGRPILDSLSEPADYIVLELSSFQLETIDLPLRALAATVLNVTADHIDRHGSLEAYAQAKHRIYREAQFAIVPKHDRLSYPPSLEKTKICFFTLETPAEEEWGVQRTPQGAWLSKGHTPVLPLSQLKLLGAHNVANALSALALGNTAGVPWATMCQILETATGLPHRMQLVGETNGIRWVNDSKATNVGACLAALEGLSDLLEGKVVLLLGGEGKQADFSVLSSSIKKYCRHLILMGKEANHLFQILGKSAKSDVVSGMAEAVQMASRVAEPGDIVLLSPACASFDQYRDFTHRGEVFIEMVKKYAGTS